MGYARALVRLTAASLIPADACMNVFHFNTTDTVAGAAADIGDVLIGFYETIDALMGNTLSGNGEITIYDLEDAPPRTPVGDPIPMTLSTGADSLPTECAAVISYHGAFTSGANRQRRMGRIYIGPMAKTNAVSEGDQVHISGTATGALAAAAGTLLSDGGAVGCLWSVFSPTSAGPEPWSAGDLAAGFSTIIAGHVDNAWDTQRRRGSDATSRQSFSV